MSGTAGEAAEEKVPRRLSMLSGTTSEAIAGG